MRLHVVGLPHTQTTRQYSNCAFTELLRKFCDMMMSLGHEVYLYASEDNEAACTELITCITKQDQLELIGITGPGNILNIKWDESLDYWRLFESNVIKGIMARQEPHDFICIASGWTQRGVAIAFPNHITVEPWCGYTGIAVEGTKHVFPSYNWMHAVYGQWYGAHGFQGRWYDRVIPHYYDVSQFPYQEDKDDYFAFIGRLNEDKGPRLAADVAKELGVRLVVAGQGAALPDGVDYRGLVGPEERADIISHARALFVPSFYLEPFGLVALEGSLCGTPVITTDWGAFPETVDQGVSGFRCHNRHEFIEAAKLADTLDPADCRAKGLQYDMERIKYDYERYFHDLEKLWGKGWST